MQWHWLSRIHLPMGKKLCIIIIPVSYTHLDVYKRQGQPIVPAEVRSVLDPRVERAKGLYSEDSDKKIRKSHENPSIQKLYAEFLEKPNSHKAHELLHTFYAAKPKFS